MGLVVKAGRQLRQIAILNNNRTPGSQMFCVLVVKEESQWENRSISLDSEKIISDFLIWANHRHQSA